MCAIEKVAAPLLPVILGNAPEGTGVVRIARVAAHGGKPPAMTSDSRKVPWRHIQPLEEAGIPSNGALAGLGALRDAWLKHLDGLTEPERVGIRQRSLRRLAIETGILERLYQIDWGLTLTLVAEGISRDVIERAGGRVDDATLATLLAQRDSLEMVIDFVKDRRRLTDSFIKELHAALTRTQETYDVIDVLGRPGKRELIHGAWKRDPNHVDRPDGTRLEYCPPEHVQSEIDQLLSLWEALDQRTDVHPIVKSAWLHHRFVQIHPFQDGNGRVARAMTLLVLEKHQFAPLVVDRHHKQTYLAALDAANFGDIKQLVTLFARLEQAALTGELERPQEEVTGRAVEVARTLAAQLSERRQRNVAAAVKAAKVRALMVEGRFHDWFNHKEQELRVVFKEQRLDADVKALLNRDDEQGKRLFFRAQAIESAHLVGHYADLAAFSSSANLRLRVSGLEMRYIAHLHGAGRDSGVMALTTFGDIGAEVSEISERTFVQTSADAFSFAHTEATGSLDGRCADLEELLDESLSVALARLMGELGQ